MVEGRSSQPSRSAGSSSPTAHSPASRFQIRSPLSPRSSNSTSASRSSARATSRLDPSVSPTTVTSLSHRGGRLRPTGDSPAASAPASGGASTGPYNSVVKGHDSIASGGAGPESDIEQVIDYLYGLPLSGFTGARNTPAKTPPT